VSTGPYAFIARGYCPGCRHQLTGLPYALHVKCPECGADTEIGDLPLAPPPSPLARFLGFPQGRHRKATWIVALGLAVVVIVAIYWPAFAPVSCRYCWSSMAATQLQAIHLSLQVYAQDRTGQYPPHAAILVPLNHFPPGDFVDSWAADGDGEVFGDVNLLTFDWSPDAMAQLDAAIASCDVSAAYYRIGDFWLTRLPGPTNSQALVAGWCDVVTDGDRWVVYDDNELELVSRNAWGDLWAADADERTRLGLPRVESPPWSDDGG